MKPISPYKNIAQYTRILLEPYQMNSDIRNNLYLNLKKKVEKKCNKNGYIDEVYSILHYDDGILLPENLTSDALYSIKYHCKICIPIENSIIISQVKVINQELVVTINGPIMIFIPKENITSTYWNTVDNFSYKSNPKIKLNIGDFVLVQIVNKRINTGDIQIKTIGKLLDLATPEQINKLFITNNEIIESTTVDETNDESNFIT